MVSIAQALGDAQLILMCGHNQVLAKRLQAMRCAAPHAVLEFTPEVGGYMRLGDFFIGKPGPGSLSEAIHMGLPVITFENAWTMPQERFNCHWVRERKVGLVIRSTRDARAAVSELTSRLSEFREHVRVIDNRAVFEVPEILAQLLHAAATPDPMRLPQLDHSACALGAGA